MSWWNEEKILQRTPNAGGSVTWCSHRGNRWRVLSEKHNYDLTPPLLASSPRRALSQPPGRSSSIHAFCQSAPNSHSWEAASTAIRAKKMWCTCTTEFYLTSNKNKITAFAGRWTDLRMVTLNKMRRAQEQVAEIFCHIQNVEGVSWKQGTVRGEERSKGGWRGTRWIWTGHVMRTLWRTGMSRMGNGRIGANKNTA